MYCWQKNPKLPPITAIFINFCIDLKFWLTLLGEWTQVFLASILLKNSKPKLPNHGIFTQLFYHGDGCCFVLVLEIFGLGKLSFFLLGLYFPSFSFSNNSNALSRSILDCNFDNEIRFFLPIHRFRRFKNIPSEWLEHELMYELVGWECGFFIQAVNQSSPFPSKSGIPKSYKRRIWVILSGLWNAFLSLA